MPRGGAKSISPGQLGGTGSSPARCPTVVVGPWPGSTSSSSGSVRNRRRLARIAAGTEFGKSERPIDPANTRSPREHQRRRRPEADAPGGVPGVWSTSSCEPGQRRGRRRPTNGPQVGRAVGDREPGAPRRRVGQAPARRPCGCRRAARSRRTPPPRRRGRRDRGWPGPRRAASPPRRASPDPLGREPRVDDHRLVAALARPAASSSCRTGCREDLEPHGGRHATERPAAPRSASAVEDQRDRPSFTSSTCMCSPNAPRPTRTPRASSAAANASTRSGAPPSGAAASDQRRPPPLRGVRVQRELRDDQHLAAHVGQRPGSSSRRRPRRSAGRRSSRPGTRPRRRPIGARRRPPGSASPGRSRTMRSPSTATEARDTRWSTTRTASRGHRPGRRRTRRRPAARRPGSRTGARCRPART